MNEFGYTHTHTAHITHLFPTFFIFSSSKTINKLVYLHLFRLSFPILSNSIYYYFPRLFSFFEIPCSFFLYLIYVTLMYLSIFGVDLYSIELIIFVEWHIFSHIYDSLYCIVTWPIVCFVFTKSDNS